MKANDYWRERFEQLETSLLDQGLGYYDEVEKQYRQALVNIEKDITVWYKRLALNNNISYADAKNLLNANELEEFHWDIEEYIKRGKENKVSQQWMKQLENASAKVHIAKLDAMKLQLQQHLEVMFGNQLDGLDKNMKQLYVDGYYHTAFELQKGFNVGYNIQKLDKQRIDQIIAKPWAADGKNFSDRIWESKDKLLNTLHTELTQATIRGDAPERAVKTIAEKLKVSKSNAGRLVMTESAFFASASQKDCFSALDVERYEIVATLDRRTSETCRHLDGKVFKMSDFKPGITAPPFHCWCRTCTAPYFEDDIGQRAARNEKGKTYYVPNSMKYGEWKKTFIDGGSKDGLQKTTDNVIKKVEFKKAYNIKEANEYATKDMGIRYADYSGLDIQVANDWNQGLTDTFRQFPELKDQFGFVGESHAKNAALKPVVRQYYLDNLKKLNPNVDVAILEKHVDTEVKKIMRRLRIPSNAYASSWSPKQEPYKQFAGITFNRVQGQDINKLLDNLNSDVVRKFHPIGCNTVKSVLDHEIGHQLDKMLSLSDKDEIKKLFNERTREQITDELSEYAWKNDNPNKYGEFIAEAWSEYRNNPNPRPIAKEIGEVVERAYVEWKKKNS